MNFETAWIHFLREVFATVVILVVTQDHYHTSGWGVLWKQCGVNITSMNIIYSVSEIFLPRSEYWSHCRTWSESIVNDACQLLAEDLPLAPGTPGGQIEYRRSLASSFFFKFYLNVSLQLSNQEVRCYNLNFLLDNFSIKAVLHNWEVKGWISY